MPKKQPALALVSPASTSSIPPPPRPLGEHGLRFWQSIQAEYDVGDAGGIELLAQASAALDLAERCRAEIDRDGPLIRLKGGVLKEHPLAKIELTARSAVCRVIRQLGIDCEPIRSGPGRPPGPR